MLCVTCPVNWVPWKIKFKNFIQTLGNWLTKCSRKMWYAKNLHANWLNIGVGLTQAYKISQFRFVWVYFSDLNVDILKRNTHEYSPELRKFATTIYLYSHKAYDYIRLHLKNLPGVSTIQSWLRKFDCSPGIFSESLEFLSEKIKTNAWGYQECTLMVDGMAIREQIDWDASKACRVGFIDYGHGPDESCKAKEAVVFLAVGLSGSWKIPIGYILSNCK